MKFSSRFVKAKNQNHHLVNWTTQLIPNLKACGTFKRIKQICHRL